MLNRTNSANRNFKETKNQGTNWAKWQTMVAKLDKFYCIRFASQNPRPYWHVYVYWEHSFLQHLLALWIWLNDTSITSYSMIIRLTLILIDIVGISRTWKGWWILVCISTEAAVVAAIFANTSRFPADISLHTSVNCSNVTPPERSIAWKKKKT